MLLRRWRRARATRLCSDLSDSSSTRQPPLLRDQSRRRLQCPPERPPNQPQVAHSVPPCVDMTHAATTQQQPQQACHAANHDHPASTCQCTAGMASFSQSSAVPYCSVLHTLSSSVSVCPCARLVTHQCAPCFVDITSPSSVQEPVHSLLTVTIAPILYATVIPSHLCVLPFPSSICRL